MQICVRRSDRDRAELSGFACALTVTGHGNMHGFTYQAQAIHRCIAAGLQGCPQFTKEESVHTCEIIDEILRQLR
jgi:hypothetical protein